MIRTRLGLLGLCAMVFALIVFDTTGALAEVGAKWLILNKAGQLKTGAELHASVQLKGETTYVFHTEILKIKTLFLCTTVELLNAKLQEEGIIGKEVVTNETTKLKEGRGTQLKSSGCTTDLNGVVNSACTPEDPVGGKGTVITKPAHGLLKLHELTSGEKVDIIKISPDTGETYATIFTGPECPIGSSVPVIGSLALKDCENLALTHLVEHLLEGFVPLTKLWSISKTAEHEESMLGSTWARLTGEHEGLKWSGDPA